MNKRTTIKPILLTINIAAVLFVAGCNETNETKAAEGELTTIDQKVTYIKSFTMLSRAVDHGVTLDAAILERAVYDAKNGIAPKIPKSDEVAIMKQLDREVAQAKKQQRVEMGEMAKKAGEDYLEQYAKRDGVHVTESGLQYRVIKAVEGDAAKPKATDSVTAHYQGYLVDGTVFDSSVEKGAPIDFPLSKVIKGWTEGLQLMKVGEKYEFVVPSNLAYGEKGSSAPIYPNSVLRFEVELLGINPEKTPE